MKGRLLIVAAVLSFGLILTHVSAHAECKPGEIRKKEDLYVFTLDQLAQLENLECLEGTLSLNMLAQEDFQVSLPRLREVTGDISIGASTVMTRVSFDSLESVSGHFHIASLSYPQLALTTVELPQLARVGQELSLASADRLTEIHYDACADLKFSQDTQALLTSKGLLKSCKKVKKPTGRPSKSLSPLVSPDRD